MEARPGEDYRDILLNLLSPIGDTLFATPAIRALRRAYPAARITALVWPNNHAVLDNNPDVDRLIPFEASWEMPRRLRRARFDLTVHFAPFHDYFGLLSGCSRRLTLPVPWLFWLLPHHNRRWRLMHARDHYLEVLRPLGIPHGDGKLVLNVSGRQEAFAERYLAEQGQQPGELLMGIHAGGSGLRGAKRWAPAGFAWVARELAKVAREELPCRRVRIVFFGDAADRPLARAVREAGVPNGCIDTCGRLSLAETIALLARLDLFVGNDSGPLHLAAALGTPVVGIYGPTNIMNFHPLGPRVRTVFGPMPCPADYGFVGSRPLWARARCGGECLDSIDPSQVLTAARELLATSDAALESQAPAGRSA